MSATCGHVKCAQREHLVAVLIKCALDLAAEVDGLKAAANIPQEEKLRVLAMVERTYDACEQLGAEIGKPQDTVPCQHVICVADICAKCGAEVPA